MGGKSKAPPPPDYTGAAQAQAAASREITEQQTWANRPDQYNPWGSVEWDNQQVWDPSTQQYLNRWQQTTTLDPTLQWALDNQMYLQGARSELGGDLMDRAQDEFGTPMDWSQFGDYVRPDAPQDREGLDLQGAVDTGGMRDVGENQYTPEQIQRQLAQTPEEIRNRAEQAIYDRSTSRLDPMWERRAADTEAKLRAQGMRPGDAAYDRAMDELNMQREDAYQTAMTESIMGGGAEAQRQFGMMGQEAAFQNQAAQQAFMQEAQRRGMTNEEAQNEWEAQRSRYDQLFQRQMEQSQYQNQLRQAQLAEEMQKRGFTLNEINALLHGQQVATPQF